MPNPKSQARTLAEALARPPRANGKRRRFYDSEVRGLALEGDPAAERAFTLDDRVIGKPPATAAPRAGAVLTGALSTTVIATTGMWGLSAASGRRGHRFPG
jgi:hypothetical protein